MRAAGFSSLSEKELVILNCFKVRDSILFPSDCDLGAQETYALLVSLRRKQILTGPRPWSLTAKGKKLVEEIQDGSSN